LFWTGQEITKDEKHEVLSLHASGSMVILCGVLSGLTISFLIVLPFTLIIYAFLEKEILFSSRLIYYFIWFAIFGGIAGWLLKKEYKFLRQEFEESKVSWVWILSLLFLFIILPELPINDSDEPFEIVYRALLYKIVGSIVLAIWLKFLWSIFDRFYLSILTRIDWRLIIDERKLCEHLRLKFAEVERYLAPLSLMAVGIDEWDSIVSQFGQKGINKLEKEMINILKTSVRQADIFGRINNGRIIIVLTNTAGAGAKVCAERVQNALQPQDFRLGKTVTKLTISVGIISYSKDITSPEEMMKKAVAALGNAGKLGKGQIVFYAKEMN
jgi:diguanylate cyclase (GGDEF)-like protein